MTSSVLRAPNGSKVQVRTGVMRGVGPQGPIGPQGQKGDTGPSGPTGPPGAVNDVALFCQSTAAVGVADDNWYDAAIKLGDPALNDGIVSFIDDYQFQFTESDGAYLIVLNTRFQPTHGTGVTGTSSGTRRARIVDASLTQFGRLFISEAAAPLGETAFVVADIVRPDPSKIYKVQLRSHDDIATTNDLRYLQIIRIGSGPQGVAGPIGPAGVQGPQGPQGPPGSATSGFSNFNGITGGTDSSAQPPFGSGTDWQRTTDQGLPYPRPTELPAIPYFLKLLLGAVEPKLVRHYTSVADRAAKRTSPIAGDVTFLGDGGNLQHREKSGTDLDIARVHVDSVAPPSGTGVAAPGVLWIQV